MIEDLELHTERLTLKVLGPTYASRVLAYLVRNRTFFKDWNPATAEDYFSLAYQEQRLRNELALAEDGWMLRLHLFERADTSYAKVIGDLVLNNIVRGAFLSCHLGYKMDQRKLGKGLMTEAIRRAISARGALSRSLDSSKRAWRANISRSTAFGKIIFTM